MVSIQNLKNRRSGPHLKIGKRSTKFWGIRILVIRTFRNHSQLNGQFQLLREQVEFLSLRLRTCASLSEFKWFTVEVDYTDDIATILRQLTSKENSSKMCICLSCFISWVGRAHLATIFLWTASILCSISIVSPFWMVSLAAKAYFGMSMSCPRKDIGLLAECCATETKGCTWVWENGFQLEREIPGKQMDT